ncbi:hypothetical protein MMC21_001677 [Puttea exsequens]|nr:hypothetical protein [Puttea exsequens]
MAVSVSDHNRPFRFFDLPREIRNDIYTRTMYFHDDRYIILAPKGRLPNYIWKPGDYRAGLYSRYQEFVSHFTILRQFRDEALPIFWRGNIFQVLEDVDLASTPELPDRINTALGFIRLSGKMYIVVFVKKPGGSKKNGE